MATVVVVPRERFSHSIKTLRSILRNSGEHFELLVVDGNSPAAIRDEMRSLGEDHGFEVLRTDSYLTPNQARNLGWAAARTKYVAFADNDLVVAPGWLDQLVSCAERSGAWAVGPLYLEGPIESGIVHMAGGEARVEEHEGRRLCHSKHLRTKEPLARVQAETRAGPTELLEFHCMLVRTDVRERLGLFDENLMSLCEHLDFCMQVRVAGGEVWYEPQSVVSYDISARFEDQDLPFFELRWSDAWNEHTLGHFRDKWRLAEDDPYLTRSFDWAARHRRLASASRVPWSLRVAGGRFRRTLGTFRRALQG